SRVDPDVLAYQYLQKLPEIAKGDANKVWIVPSEMGRALQGVGTAFDRLRDEVVRAP
ncbi:SPFH/Band 7/PHB domain protein, partial [Nocardiopsis tropica]|nr:SPFH/Band 7/PHB domain protein [Nocardiopsis tropica]